MTILYRLDQIRYMDGPCGQVTGSLKWEPTRSDIQRKEKEKQTEKEKGTWQQEKDGHVREGEQSRGWNKKKGGGYL